MYLLLGGVSGPGGYLVWGDVCVPAPGGVYLLPGGTCPGTPPPVDRHTRVKISTFEKSYADGNKENLKTLLSIGVNGF